VNNKANAWLYGCFAAFSLLAPSVCGKLGPRLTLFVGSLGYSVFVVALLLFREGTVRSEAVVVGAAAVNGVGAALLWTAQGQLLMGYPTAAQKGTYFAVFWVLFNVGGVAGGLITLFSNLDSTGSTASKGTFIIFLCIMLVGSACTRLLSPADEVRRSDGTAVVFERQEWSLRDVVAMARLFLDWRTVMLAPMFLYSNWFFGYHFGVFNAGLFNVRTQGYNTAWYWGAEMLGAFAIGRCLDADYRTLRYRALLALGALCVYVNLTWYWALTILTHSSQVNSTTGERDPKLDLTDGASASPFMLYWCWGFVDLTISSWNYWLMGQLTSDLQELARFAGFYKAIQSTGGAIAWSMGGYPPIVQLYTNWLLFTIAVPPAAYVAYHALGAVDDKRRAGSLAPDVGGDGGGDGLDTTLLQRDSGGASPAGRRAGADGEGAGAKGMQPPPRDTQGKEGEGSPLLWGDPET